MSDEENSIPENSYGVLTIDQLQGLKLISGEEVDDKCYSNASFDFRLGPEYFFPHLYQDEVNKIGRPLNDKEKEDILISRIGNCSNEGYLKIPKFTSVVISTYESVKIPDHVAGRFDLRIKWAIAGLILQVGTQIEPGYEGKLWGLLHNFSNEEVIISYKQYEHRLLTAEFYFLNKPSPPTNEKKKKPTSLKEFLLKYPVKNGSLYNYFEQVEQTKADIKTMVESSQATIQEQVGGQLAQIEQVRIRVEHTNDRLSSGRNFWVSFWIVLGTFVVSLVLPIVISRFTLNKSDYESIENKVLKNHMDSVNTQLGRTITKLQNDIDSLKTSKKAKKNGKD